MSIDDYFLVETELKTSNSEGQMEQKVFEAEDQLWLPCSKVEQCSSYDSVFLEPYIHS